MTDKTQDDNNPIARRNFLLGAGTAVAAGLAPPAPAEAQQQARLAQASPPQTTNDEGFLTLTATEAAFFSAAVDTIIPADDLSPSGSDCGVATFIDRQLAGAWGGGAKMYRSGPFPKGKPEQGYQLPLTPREFFAAGVVATNEWTRKSLRQGLRPAGAEGPRSGTEGAGGGQGRVRRFQRHAVLRRAAADHHGGLLRRSDLWRQPQQGRPGRWSAILVCRRSIATLIENIATSAIRCEPQSIADFS